MNKLAFMEGYMAGMGKAGYQAGPFMDPGALTTPQAPAKPPSTLTGDQLGKPPPPKSMPGAPTPIGKAAPQGPSQIAQGMPTPSTQGAKSPLV